MLLSHFFPINHSDKVFVKTSLDWLGHQVLDTNKQENGYKLLLTLFK